MEQAALLRPGSEHARGTMSEAKEHSGSQKSGGRHRAVPELTLEAMLSRGQVPLEVLTDYLFGERACNEVILHAPFDPLPLRQHLTARGCEMERIETDTGGWSYRIRRVQSCEGALGEPVRDGDVSFWFDQAGLHLDVTGVSLSRGTLEVLRFLDGQAHDGYVVVHMPDLPPRLLTLLQERGWNWEILGHDAGQAMVAVSQA